MIISKKIDKRLHGLELSFKNLLVLKTYASRLQLKNTKKISTTQMGNQTAISHGRGMDFVEVRRYQPGDDIRSMDWRVTARTGKPHTKLFQEEREQPVYLLLNLSSSMQFGTQVTFKSIIAAQIAALLAWKTTLNKDRVGGLIYNDTASYFSKPHPGNRGVLPFLRKIIELNQLQQIAPIKHNSIISALANYKALLMHGCKFFIISDFYKFEEAEQRFYAQLSKNNQLHLLHIYDVLEAEAPKPNLYSVSNGKNIFQFDTRSAVFQQRYQQTFNAHLEKLQYFCKQQKIRFASIRTDADVTTELHGI